MDRLTSHRDTVDIAKGFGGVVVKPRFFSPAAFDIPAAYWAVDDIWLSGQLALTNVPIRPLSSPIKTMADDNASIDALLDLEIQLRNRQQLDFECVRFFQNHYRIWSSAEHEKADL